MRATTLRRLLVLAVCGAGVAALYLIPGLRQPEQIQTVSSPLGRPDPSPTPTPPAPDPQSASESDSSDPPESAESRPTEAETAPVSTTTATVIRTTAAREARRHRGRDDEQSTGSATSTTASTSATTSGGSTSTTGQPMVDRLSPTTVTGLRVTDRSDRSLALAWNPASDNVGVAGYLVSLNSVRAAVVERPAARVGWFNDDTDEHFVQVRAFDAAGNLSRTALALEVERPSPSPTPSQSETAPAPSASASDGATGRRHRHQSKPTAGASPSATSSATTSGTDDHGRRGQR